MQFEVWKIWCFESLHWTSRTPKLLLEEQYNSVRNSYQSRSDRWSQQRLALTQYWTRVSVGAPLPPALHMASVDTQLFSVACFLPVFVAGRDGQEIYIYTPTSVEYEGDIIHGFTSNCNSEGKCVGRSCVKNFQLCTYRWSNSNSLARVQRSIDRRASLLG